MIKDLLKEWKIWILIIFIAGSIAGIGPHYQKKNGDVVIGLNLNKGLDLGGGAEILAVPEKNVTQKQLQDIKEILKVRNSASGLQDVSVSIKKGKYIQIRKAGATVEELEKLTEQEGHFEARVPINVKFNESFTLGDEKYTLRRENNYIKLNGKKLRLNRTDSFNLSSGKERKISMDIINRSDDELVLSSLAFTGEDIFKNAVGSRLSGVSSTSQGDYRFRFDIMITVSAAKRFKDITQALDVVTTRGGRHLSSKLKIYLDGNLTTSFSISEVFKTGDPVTNPSITGGEETQAKAQEEMKHLKALMKSGSLPSPLEEDRPKEISPRLGEAFTHTAFLAIFLAVIAVSVVIFIRYRNPKIAFPILVTGLSEVIVLLSFYSSGTSPVISSIAIIIPTIIGMALCFRENPLALGLLPAGALAIFTISSIPASLDLPAVAGIVAAVGTGIDDQVIITDEGAKKRLKSLKARIKRAFFIIFTSAASTIGAMIPLFWVGFGRLTNFATATIVGVIVGITVTRPAYAKVLEYLE